MSSTKLKPVKEEQLIGHSALIEESSGDDDSRSSSSTILTGKKSQPTKPIVKQEANVPAVANSKKKRLNFSIESILLQAAGDDRKRKIAPCQADLEQMRPDSPCSSPESFASNPLDDLDGDTGEDSADDRPQIPMPPSSVSSARLRKSMPSIASHSRQNPQPAIQSYNSQASTSTGEARLANISCTLDNRELWEKFHANNTEMIITKTGRRMFPVMKVQFHNLNPNSRYAVSMDIIQINNKRYRYQYNKSSWIEAGKADPSAEPRMYPHPDSPFQGDVLARQVISFEKVKLTNNEMDKNNHIILNSMHRYQPRVHLIEFKTPQPQLHQPAQPASSTSSAYRPLHHHHNQHNQNNHRNPQQPQQAQQQLDIEGYRTFVFPETVFTAVTAYQNQLITKMKIDKNPFAKGFRDSSRLSDLDRNDPFDYMGSLGASRFASLAAGCAGSMPPGVGHSLHAGSVPQPLGALGGPGGGPGPTGAPLDPLAAAAAGVAHMDAYQALLANNPWYSAAAMAAASGAAAAASNPFSPAATSSAQAAQFQTQMWLAAALSSCLNGAAAASSAPSANTTSTSTSSSNASSGAPSGMQTASHQQHHQHSNNHLQQQQHLQQHLHHHQQHLLNHHHQQHLNHLSAAAAAAVAAGSSPLAMLDQHASVAASLDPHHNLADGAGHDFSGGRSSSSADSAGTSS